MTMRIVRRVTKRAFDLAFVLVAAPVALPVGIAGAALVKLTSPGPAIFAHPRIGRGGSTVRVKKLRTMVKDAASRGAAVTASQDPRITPVGRLLRKTKIDELPQLINVVMGEMSVVGPRPEAPAYVDREDPRWHMVLSVPPGITDLASLAFRHEEDLLALAIDRERAYREVILPSKLALAAQGIERSSFVFDISIVARTALAIVRMTPSHEEGVVRDARERILQLNASLRDQTADCIH